MAACEVSDRSVARDATFKRGLGFDFPVGLSMLRI